MIVFTEKEIYSDAGKYVHRIGTEAYFKRCVALPVYSAETFEEVETIPAPPTEEELSLQKEVEAGLKERFFRDGIQREINTYALTAREALAVKDLYPEWEAGLAVKECGRYRSAGILWECVKAHTTQDNWKPSIHTASLWKVVEVEHEGAEGDPIPYTPPMELSEGKYYTQKGEVYKCVRDSVQPLTHDLSVLVGHYVERIN